MPVKGLVRLRRHLFARQSAFGTAVAAVRAYPFSNVPDADEQWTEVGADFGSLYPIAKRFRGAGEYGFNGSRDPLNYNDLALDLSGFFGGSVAGTGSPEVTRTWTPSALSADDFDLYSYEFGDDMDGDPSDESNDWEQYSDGILTSLTIDSPETGNGQLSVSEQWSFLRYAYQGSTDNPPNLAIPSITAVPDTDATPLYLKDAKIYVDSDPSDIGGYQLTDSVHKFTLRMTQEAGKKYYVNGTGTFAANAWDRGAVKIEVDLVYGKTADTVGLGSEMDAWSADVQLDRYLSVVFESTREISPGVPYSWDFSMPMRYFQMAHGAINNNTTRILTGEAWYEPDVLQYPFTSTLVNTLADADL
jgi:hypothetical protein